jgi:hypothetical protein
VTPEAIVEFTETLARIAASGGGPKALTAHLAQATGAGVLLEDAQWRHLATAGSSSSAGSARATVESGAPVGFRCSESVRLKPTYCCA